MNFKTFREFEGFPKIQKSILKKDSLKDSVRDSEKNEKMQHFLKNEFQIKINKPASVAESSGENLYEDNSGTAITIKMDNKLLIAADTRHNSSYTINSRNMSKIYKLGSFFLTTTGFYADGYEVYIKLMYEIQQYETYGKIGIQSAAHLLHNILYNRRFFPLWSYCCLSGFEEKDDGSREAVVFSYDCVGSYERVNCRVDGSGTTMIQPLLDSWIDGKNFENFKGISFENGVELVKAAFDSASERDLMTGDTLEIYIFDGENIKHEFVELRKD